MILRCLQLLLIATIAISQAEFTEIQCEFIEETDRGLQCEFNNVFMLDTTNIKVTELNTSIDSVVFRQSELHSVPSEIFQKFPHVKHLDVDLTQMKVIRPDNFFNANQLKYFLARFNEITRLESHTFSSCPQLKFIVLQNNKISTIHQNAFYGLNKLTSLHLDYNRISALPSNVLDPLPNLLQFSMAYNNLTIIPDDLFMKNEKLEDLNLGHNMLTEFNDEQFHELPYLEHVQLDHNMLTELNFAACKSKEINVDYNNLRQIELNKWTKEITAWGNPINKLILHEHYGTGRAYNFSFNDVNEIVFYVHEHCCTVENLENFYILTLSFGDLSEKNLDVNDWSCKFRKNVGYESDKGYVTNNVCVKRDDIATTTITAVPISTHKHFNVNARLNLQESAESEEITTNSAPVNEQIETTKKNVFENGFIDESSNTENEEEFKANVQEYTTTESYETKAEKSIWGSLKKKAKSFKNKVKSKWNSWFS